jgi:hypothetical protein
MLISYEQGRYFEICFWAEGSGECEALEFLEGLRAGGKRERQDFQTLTVHRLQRMAHQGTIYNEEQSKELEDGIYEFKAPGGARLLWFYCKSHKRVVVCTHGFRKPPSNRGYRAEISKAKAMRLRYEEDA